MQNIIKQLIGCIILCTAAEVLKLKETNCYTNIFSFEVKVKVMEAVLLANLPVAFVEVT